MKIDSNEIIDLIQDTQIILIGLGEEFFVNDENKEFIVNAYKNLSELLVDKNYFIISLSDDKLLDEAFGSGERIVKILTEPEADTQEVKNWGKYNKWLTATLNNNLLILELGVGLNFPQFIRFPFEKVAFYNMKSQFVRVHHMLYQLPQEIGDKGYCLKQNAVDLLNSFGD